jgi:hypothetical protein
MLHKKDKESLGCVIQHKSSINKIDDVNNQCKQDYESKDIIDDGDENGSLVRAKIKSTPIINNSLYSSFKRASLQATSSGNPHEPNCLTNVSNDSNQTTINNNASTVLFSSIISEKKASSPCSSLSSASVSLASSKNYCLAADNNRVFNSSSVTSTSSSAPTPKPKLRPKPRPSSSSSFSSNSSSSPICSYLSSSSSSASSSSLSSGRRSQSQLASIRISNTCVQGKQAKQTKQAKQIKQPLNNESMSFMNSVLAQIGALIAY